MNQGVLCQDIASNQAISILADEYLGRLGFDDVATHVASSHWNGMFPTDEAAAYAMISLNTMVAASTGAPLVYVKSVEEGVGVPTAEGNAASVRATRYALHLLAGQSFGVDDAEVAFERDLQLLEARAILDAVLTMGDGDPVVGLIAAFDRGVLDVPLAANDVAHGRVLPMRDARGCVRFADWGGLPLPAEARRIEAQRLAERAGAVGHALGYSDLVADINFPAPEMP
jgi:methylaspartate mutase epsilon subunit